MARGGSPLRYYLAIDEGSTDVRSIVFDEEGRTVAISKKRVREYYPREHWVEKDPIEVLKKVEETIKEVVHAANIKFADLQGLGLANEGETTVIWDGEMGQPVYNAISWQDRRVTESCKKLSDEGIEEDVHRKTGLRIESYFSACKAKWILDNAVKEQHRRGMNDKRLLFGTLDSWILWNLTGRKLHVTDVSTASRTMVFDINKLEWDEDLISKLGLASLDFPKVVTNAETVGVTDKEITGGAEIPIAGLATDQQASLFGHSCFNEGDTKITYGTGAFLLTNIGTTPKFSDKLLTTVAWKVNGKPEYALDGGVYSAGSTVKWMEQIGLVSSEEELSKVSIGEGSEGKEEVFMIPAFAGIAAPYWSEEAKGSIHGLTLATTKRQIVRAALQSIANLISDITEAIELEIGKKPGVIRADGGASTNDYLMQFQSDLLGIPMLVSQFSEVTSFGIASLSKYALDKRGFIGYKHQYIKYTPIRENFAKYQRLRQKWKGLLLDELRRAQTIL